MALDSNEAGFDTPGDLHFLDDGSSSNIDSTFFLPAQVDDNSPLTAYDLTYSDLGILCSSEAMQNGENCEVPQQLLSLQSLDFSVDLHSDTKKPLGAFGSASCSVGYHLCCNGPTGSYGGMIYDRIEHCSFGMISRDVVLAHSSPSC